MATCPTCGAEFPSDKLLQIHQKYCRTSRPSPHVDNGSDVDKGHSTEKLDRDSLLTDVAAHASNPARSEHVASLDDSSPLLVAEGLSTGMEETPPTVSPAPRNIVEEAKKRLRLSVKPVDSLLLVHVRGELVVWTSLQLNAAIAKLLATEYRFVILDVTGITQCDATGLGAVLLFSQELRDRGGRLILAAPTETREKFEIIKGFTRAVEFCESVDTAIAEIRTPPPSL